eukprot:TRINITY_DN77934_c0_g1_i1.p1 TRINITY_DN77934_c0_g1~~TRINITY_DN77934_c0_g1_i1.p1  ORF type:complete len:258 (+),score=45.56 TRINITY_DN77934_c0_g1_i1:79-774(+)
MAPASRKTMKEIVDLAEETEEDAAKVKFDQELRSEKDNYLRPGLFLDDPPEEFLAVVEKESSTAPLGICFDPSSGSDLVVREIKVGPVTELNKTAARSMCDIRQFDRVVAVNGVYGDSEDLLKELSRDKTVELLVRRPKPYEVRVSKPVVLESIPASHYRTGIVVEDIGDSLLVLGVASGIFKNWNNLHWDTPIRGGDRIVEINGVRGNAAKIARQLQDFSVKSLHVKLEH